MKEAILDKSVASLTLQELIETFREVIREEREHYIDAEGKVKLYSLEGVAQELGLEE